jgi:hypothetical protein
MFPKFPTTKKNKNIYINFKGLLKKNFVYAVQLTPHARFLRSKIDHFLGEFEAEFKKALARESGAQGVFFDEKKTEGRKSRDTVP